MKNFSSKTKESSLRNSRLRSVRTLVICASIAFIVLLGGRSFVSTMASWVTTPFFSIRHYIETSSATVPVFLRGRIELEEQIRTLEDEVGSQVGIRTTLDYVMEENKELRSLLGATGTSRIGAGVIARPPYTPYDTVIIDQGSDDGVIEFAPVYYGAQKAIGYVRKTYARTSLVTLFSSPGIESTVFVFGPNLFTSAYGEGGGVVRISVPQGVPIQEGNMVILPSLDTGVLGTIDHIESIPTEPEQHAYITFDIPLQSLRLVSVGTVPIKSATFAVAEQEVREVEKMLFTIEVPPDHRFTVSTTSSSTNVVGTTTATTTP